MEIEVDPRAKAKPSLDCPEIISGGEGRLEDVGFFLPTRLPEKVSASSQEAPTTDLSSVDSMFEALRARHKMCLQVVMGRTKQDPDLWRQISAGSAGSTCSDADGHTGSDASFAAGIHSPQRDGRDQAASPLKEAPWNLRSSLKNSVDLELLQAKNEQCLSLLRDKDKESVCEESASGISDDIQSGIGLVLAQLAANHVSQLGELRSLRKALVTEEKLQVLGEKHRQALQELQDVKQQHSELQGVYSSLKAMHASLQEQHRAVQADRRRVLKDHEALQEHHQELRRQVVQLREKARSSSGLDVAVAHSLTIMCTAAVTIFLLKKTQRQ